MKSCNSKEPIFLSGGRENKIIKIGNQVIRPAGTWTKQIHQLLRHVRKKGFLSAPEPIDINQSGQEIISFIHGDVSNYPLSKAAKSISALTSAAILLRRYHDASETFLSCHQTNSKNWQLPPRNPIEVICHGDFAPYNVVLNQDVAVGIIDFDTCHPGPRIWDIAYALYRWAPFTNPNNHDGFGDIDTQIKRAQLFCQSYGLQNKDSYKIAQFIIERLEALVDFIKTHSQEEYSGHKEHLKLYEADIDYIKTHTDKINIALEISRLRQ